MPPYQKSPKNFQPNLFLILYTAEMGEVDVFVRNEANCVATDKYLECEQEVLVFMI